MQFIKPRSDSCARQRRKFLSYAMALALPTLPGRNLIVVMTYGVVAFSILVQGLSFGPLLRRLGIGKDQA